MKNVQLQNQVKSQDNELKSKNVEVAVLKKELSDEKKRNKDNDEKLFDLALANRSLCDEIDFWKKEFLTEKTKRSSWSIEREKLKKDSKRHR